MRTVLVLVSILITSGFTVDAQTFHPPVYLFAGRGQVQSPSTYASGIYRYDARGTVPTVTKVCDIPSHSTQNNSFCMDYDNKNYLMCMGSSSTPNPWSNAVVRYDVNARSWSTIVGWPANGSPYPGPNFYITPTANVFVDQSGDYLFPVLEYDRKTSPTTVHRTSHWVYKYDRVSGAVATVLSTSYLQPAGRSYFLHLAKDIDTGKVLVADYRNLSIPVKQRYPVWSITPENGYNSMTAGAWNDGSTYGWKPVYKGVDQNMKSGWLERPYYRGIHVYKLPPGSATLQTIANLPTTNFPPASVLAYSGKFDQQTTSSPRFLLNASNIPGAWLLHYDVKNNWAVTTFDTLMDKNTHPQYGTFFNVQFEFDGGRHIQTVLASPNRWHIRVSVPHLAGRRYLMVAGISGVRPGVPVPDGRLLHLMPDRVTEATMNGWLPGIWKPGPGILDKWGEARGMLDLSRVRVPAGGFGYPLWIAVIVLDAAAPLGIAYLPDTYVMRV